MADLSDDKAVVNSEWGKSLSIPEQVIQEVKLFNQLGWALDNYGKPRELSEPESKMMALICHKLGLSPVGKQVMFLGNSIYVAKSGKVSKARRDDIMPLVRATVRPATLDERKFAGLIHNDPEKALVFEHYWHAEIYAMVKGEIQLVASEFGHACVGNINLRGKEVDPRRLCSDMAKTRAVSRALSMIYDFYGVESYEEVAINNNNQPSQPVLDTTVEIVDDTEGGCSVQDVLKLMEDNKEYLPENIDKKYTKEVLSKYTPDGLLKTKEMLDKQIEKEKGIRTEQQSEPGDSETKKPKKTEKGKGPAAKSKKE